MTMWIQELLKGIFSSAE